MTEKDNKKQENEEEAVEETLDEFLDEMFDENGGAESAAEDSETKVEAEEKENTALEDQLESALDEAAKNLDGWQRAQAEFRNYRERQDRERQQMYDQAVGRIVKRYLDIVDDLERALGNQPDDAEVAEWSQGIELVYRKLLTMLENEGVRPMEALGAEFNPMLHEAISQEESEEYESGQVIEVVRQGYTIGERMLRPALVKVAS